MGVNGLWQLITPHRKQVEFAEYALENGFLPKYSGTRTFHLGIDASVLLDGYSAANIKYGRFQHHAPTDSSLIQFFRFLTQLSAAPADCTFVYEGSERAATKRGIRVVKREPLYYQKSKELVEAFGFRVHNATGDAEAELAIMNQRSIIDAVLTKDSDIFPLGARCILKVIPNVCTDSKLIVDVYTADHIRETHGLSTGGLILYSLLVGNDIDNGIDGFGPVRALAVAQCGHGDSLITEYRQMSGPHNQRRYLENLKLSISNELKYNTHSQLLHREPACAQRVLSSSFPSQDALDWFLDPPTSWSGPAHAPDTSLWLPQGHNLPRIAQFCVHHIGWSPQQTLKKFRAELWRGVIIRILCSKYLAYDSTDGTLLTPLHSAFLTTPGGQAVPLINSSTIKGRNPPNLSAKAPGDTVRLTFDVSDLNRMTLLRVAGQEELSQVLNVSVPFALIAAATGQHHRIASYSGSRAGYLNTERISVNTQNQQITVQRCNASTSSALLNDTPDTANDPSDDEIEIGELRPLKRRRVEIIDLTSAEDVL